MDSRQTIEKLKSKIVRRALMKSLFVAFTAGCVANLIIAAIAYYNGGGYFWIGFIALAVVTAALTPVVYKFRFRPNAVTIAREIDSLGLEERMITMRELEGDDSTIAIFQREDTFKALNAVDEKLILMSVPIWLVIVVSITLALSLATSTVSVLAANGVIKRGGDVIEDIIGPDPVYFELNYETDGNGIIEGDIFQLVKQGDDAESVFAVADDDWIFAGWSEAGEPWSPSSVRGVDVDPFRQDKNVNGDTTYVAHFIRADNGADEDPDHLGFMEANDATDKPPEEGEGQSQRPSGDQEPEPGGIGGAYFPHNQVYDGETYYGGETFVDAYQDAVEALDGDNDIPDERKRLVVDYYDIIEK